MQEYDAQEIGDVSASCGTHWNAKLCKALFTSEFSKHVWEIYVYLLNALHPGSIIDC